MNRRRRRRDSQAVSLFPFLAVLVCTMGVLIVLLVIAVKGADVKAKQSKQQQQELIRQQRDELQSKLETEQLRIEGLSELRPDVQKRLRDERLQRSHLEQEIRNLRKKALELKEAWQNLDLDYSVAQESLASDTERLNRLREQIARKRDAFNQLREQVAGRPVMYSIVPTKSKNGTQRRPIYVECTPRGITLQPSGIHLNLDDFALPIVPGNPLDAALLAIREYWNTYDIATAPGEPYPLLVVRPGGATAYAIARRAMQSWDDEFGYELVDASIQLNYGKPDTQLAKVIAQTIDSAVGKQRQLAALNRAHPSSPVHTQVANRVRRNLNSLVEEDAGQTSGLSPNPQSSQTPTSSQKGSGWDTPLAGENDEPLTVGRFGQSTANESAAPSHDHFGFGNLGQEQIGQSSPYQNNHRSSEFNPLRNPSSGGAGSRNNAQSAGSGAWQLDIRSAATDSASPLAARRGRDWALPTRTQGATAYRRPIRVVCDASSILVYSGILDTPPTRIQVEGSVESSVDRLVEQIWQQIESWGMAEAGGYWKPVLRLAAEPAGEDRARQLARLLEGSGLEVEGSWR